MGGVISNVDHTILLNRKPEQLVEQVTVTPSNHNISDEVGK